MVFIIYLTLGSLVSKYELACYIKELIKSNKNIKPIKTNDFKSLAKRQLNSNLNCNKLDKLLSFKRLDWKVAVKEYIFDLEKQNFKNLSILNKIKFALRNLFKCLNEI